MRSTRSSYPISSRPVRAAILAFALVLVLAGACPAAAAGGSADLPPVDDPPVDLFRPPAGPFGAGNRGLEYRPAPGTPVRASGAGEVVFAGPVGGALHVTVLHADGLRTSYSFLASLDVRLGDRVGQAEVLGRSSGLLHFGVRDGPTYLDPLGLFAAGPARVRLVPEPTGEHAITEASALVPVVLEAVRGERWPVAVHYLTETDLELRLARVAYRVVDRWTADAPCTSPSTVPPPPEGPRIAVLVGGLGSTDTSASVDRVDTAGLGYGPSDVLRFSYAGGRVPGRPPSGPLTSVAQTPYDRDHSQGDLVEAAGRLRALLAEVAAARPGVPIDVIAHSQGGVVAQLALTDLVPGPAVPGAVDLVATLGSPHQGTDLATAIAAVHGAPAGPEALALVEGELDTGLDPGAPAVGQLSEVSPLMAALDAAPPPAGVRLLSLAARGDLVVPAVHSRLWDAPRQVIDLTGRDAHGALPGSPATTRELALALAGAPPTCRDALEVLADEAVPEAISLAEDTIGAAAWALAWAGS